MNIYVLRHGQTDFNFQGKFQGRLDIDLNENGIKQLKETKKQLEKINFDLVFVSSLKRAIHTAEIVTNKKLIIDDRIIERNFGKLEGKYSILDYEEKIDLYQIESRNAIRKRVKEFLDEILHKYKNSENILIVTHSVVAQTINSYFDKKCDEKNFHIDNGKFVKYSV